MVKKPAHTKKRVEDRGMLHTSSSIALFKNPKNNKIFKTNSTA